MKKLSEKLDKKNNSSAGNDTQLLLFLYNYINVTTPTPLILPLKLFHLYLTEVTKELFHHKGGSPE